MEPFLIAVIVIISVLAFVIIFILLMHLFSRSYFGRRFEGDVRFNFLSIRDYPNLKRENVYLYNRSHARLNGGLYYYPSDKYEGLIIFYHGLYSAHLNYLNVIEFFAKHNYKVITFDFMGNMSSGGKSIRGMPNVTSDVKCIIDYVVNSESFKGLAVYTVGHSWGGYSSMISLLHDDSRVQKSVAFSPYNSNVDCTYSLHPILKIFSPFVYLYNLIFFGHYSTYKVVDAIKYSDKKKMIICGGLDVIVRPQYSYKKFKKAADENLELIYLKDANHFTYMRKDGADNFAKEISFPHTGPIEFQKIDYEAINSLNIDLLNRVLDFLKK